MLDSMVCKLMAQIFSMAESTSSKTNLLPQNSDFKSSPELNNNQTTVVDVLACEPHEDNTQTNIRATILNDTRWLFLSLAILIVLCMVWLASWMI